MHNNTNHSNLDLQQLITNAVHSALNGSGIESKTETVSTDSSLQLAALSKKACDRRLRTIGRKVTASKK